MAAAAAAAATGAAEAAAGVGAQPAPAYAHDHQLIDSMDAALLARENRDAIMANYVKCLGREQFGQRFPNANWAEICRIVKQLRSTQPTLQYSAQRYTLLRAANKLAGYSCAGALTYTAWEGQTALLQHIRGEISQREARQQYGPAEATLQEWCTKLRSRLELPHGASLASYGDKGRLQQAVAELGIATRGRRAYLTPCEAAVLVGHLLNESKSGRNVARAYISTFGVAVLHQMAENMPEGPERERLERATCSPRWVQRVLANFPAVTGAAAAPGGITCKAHNTESQAAWRAAGSQTVE